MMSEMDDLRNNHMEGAALGVVAKRRAALSLRSVALGWRGPLANARGSFPNPQPPIPNPQSPISNPQPPAPTPHRARGFTLVELIVSMGVLVGLMTMVGMIFSIATNAASTGTANMSVHRLLRMTR